MKVKVCGMKFRDNITELCKLPIDMMGFIFYPKSPRYIGDPEPELFSEIPVTIQKTGVFVNETYENIILNAKKYHLQAIQLHGSESPDMCKLLINQGYIVIKAFSIDQKEDLLRVDPYEDVCNYFLFDTKTPVYGGSGQQYDWNILYYYKGKIPFILSGGIGSNDVRQLKEFSHPLLYGIDLNSCFETEPGRKDIQMLQDFLSQLDINKNKKQQYEQD